MIREIKTYLKKIVNNINNKAIMNIAIFFYLVLIFFKFKNNEYNEAIDNTNEFLNVLFQAAPVAVGAAASAAGTTAGAGAGAAAGAGAGTAAGAGTTAGAGAGTTAGAGAGTTAGAPGAQVAAPKPGMNPQLGNTPNPGQPNNLGSTTNAANKSNVPNKTGMENSPNELKNKNTNLDKDITDKKSSSLNEETKEKKHKRLNSETEKENEDEEDSDLDEASSELKKDKKIPIIIGVGCVGGFMTFIMMSVFIPFMLVSPITNIVEGLIKLEGTAANISEFFEKTKNAILLRGFGTDEEVLYKKIQEKYNLYLASSIKIDVPLLAATLFYSSEVTEYDSEGIPKISENLRKRINNVDELADAMVGVIEYKYNCIEEIDEDGNVSYRKILISTTRIDSQTRNTSTCDSSTAGKEVYDIRYELDIEKYMTYLRESDVLEKIYGDTAKTEEQKERIISEIIFYRDLWEILYDDLKDDHCDTSGNIPYDVLSQLQSPIKGRFRVSSYFGYRIHPIEKITKFHNGIDAVAEEDSNIYSAASGVVTAVVNSNSDTGYGSYVYIEHELFGVKYTSRYAHLRYNSITVSRGDEISIGTKIGVMGTTGSSTGDHLHFEFLRGSSRLNPVDLFRDAYNFIYDCEIPSSMGDCSLLSSIAVLAQENKYDFNLIRAIIEKESNGKTHSDEGLMIINFSLRHFLEDVSKINNPDITTQVNETFKEENGTRYVKIDGNWVSFESATNQNLRHQVVSIAASITEQAYDSVAMGLGQVMGFHYNTLGYSSSKHMFEELSKSVYAQAKAMIEFGTKVNPSFGELLKTSAELPDSDLDGMCMQVKSYYNPRGEDQYAVDICNNYRTFRNDSTSNIENYINECVASLYSIPWGCPFTDSSDCIPSTSIVQKTNEIFSDTSLSLKEKRLIEIAKTLWLKVSYCNQTAENKPRNCGSWEYNRVGIYEGWSTQRYGLDCGGFITWITNQYLNRKDTPYVLNSPGACTQNTDYSTFYDFKQGNISTVAADLRPGDVLCDTIPDRHVVMYLGYDDLNNNGVLDGNDRMYYIHSSRWDNGVIISSNILPNMGRYNSYYRYK